MSTFAKSAQVNSTKLLIAILKGFGFKDILATDLNRVYTKSEVEFTPLLTALFLCFY